MTTNTQVIRKQIKEYNYLEANLSKFKEKGFSSQDLRNIIALFGQKQKFIKMKKEIFKELGIEQLSSKKQRQAFIDHESNTITTWGFSELYTYLFERWEELLTIPEIINIRNQEIRQQQQELERQRIEKQEDLEARIKEATQRWITRDFSKIPLELIKKACYDGQTTFGEDIEILAPTIEDYVFSTKKQGGSCDHKDIQYCSDCSKEDDCINELQEEYDNDVPILPMWGTVFVPDDPFDKKWIEQNANKVAECGIILYRIDELDLVYLGINGAGYDFYQSHWIPLYNARGFLWHE